MLIEVVMFVALDSHVKEVILESETICLAFSTQRAKRKPAAKRAITNDTPNTVWRYDFRSVMQTTWHCRSSEAWTQIKRRNVKTVAMIDVAKSDVGTREKSPAKAA